VSCSWEQGNHCQLQVQEDKFVLQNNSNVSSLDSLNTYIQIIICSGQAIFFGNEQRDSGKKYRKTEGFYKVQIFMEMLAYVI